MAAAAAARIAGVPEDKIAAAVRTFKAVEHRLEFVAEIGGVRFYNDSKATSVDATMKAIDSFDGNLWVILGGKDKGSDYTALRDRLQRKAHAALLIGAAAEKIAVAAGRRDAAGARRERWSARSPIAWSQRAAGRYRAAGAGVLQLRSVSRATNIAGRFSKIW